MHQEPETPAAAHREVQQRWMDSVARARSATLDSGTIVVVPSVSFPTDELKKIIGIQYYEERLMYTLLYLRDPNVRIAYLTSLEVDEVIVDYYLRFVSRTDARDRLRMIHVGDPEPAALTGKILRSESAMEAVTEFVSEDETAYIFPFNVTELEQRLAERLGVPLYGPYPDLVSLGSKSGSRHSARAAGVPVLEGSEDLFSLGAVEEALSELKKNRPDAKAAVVKLNNGFSGQGNAVVDLTSFVTTVVETPTVFCASEESWASFRNKIAAEGAIVEEQIKAPGISSPSVQLRIAPGGSIETLSTHDQILGGPDDQVYLGCRFPAREAYRRDILDLALATAEVLADKGVFGVFGIDFIVVPRNGSWDVYLSEINLRVGGTTHPFNMALLVTGGAYDFGTGELTVDGVPKFYISTDNLKAEEYIGMTPEQAIDAIDEAGLAYDSESATGVTLHLMGALQPFGKLGVLAIANSHEAAQALYEHAVTAVQVAAAG
ncbi:MAG: peptide ligase PGM1-related protein [Actinomycetota bacterium]|nr:peptide ligase PGM1-related protein [Actinomycetota bacterium]